MKLIQVSCRLFQALLRKRKILPDFALFRRTGIRIRFRPDGDTQNRRASFIRRNEMYIFKRFSGNAESFAIIAAKISLAIFIMRDRK